jgi:hypothetical protein
MQLKLPDPQELTNLCAAHAAGFNLPGRALCTSRNATERVIPIDLKRRHHIYVPDFRHPSIPAGVNIISGLAKIYTEAGHIREKNVVDHSLIQILDAHYHDLDKGKQKLAADNVIGLFLDLAEAIEYRFEWARMQVFSTGALTVAHPTAIFAVDYQVAADHKVTLTTTSKWDGDGTIGNFVGSVPGDFRNAKQAVEAHSGKQCTDVVMNQTTYDQMWAALEVEFPGTNENNALPPGWRDQHLNNHVKQIKGVEIHIDNRMAAFTEKDGTTAVTMLANGAVVFHTGTPIVRYNGLVTDLDAPTSNGHWAKTNVVADPSSVETIVQANEIPSLPNPDEIYILTAY